MTTPKFMQREILAHYDHIPLLMTAESQDGRKWGGMMCGPNPAYEAEYLMVMFLVTDADFASFETEPRDPLKGNYLRNLMATASEVWLVEWDDDIKTLAKWFMQEDYLPTAEA